MEEEEYIDRGVVYYSGTCEFLDMVEYRWRSQGEGTFRLLRQSQGAKFFQFWQKKRFAGGRLHLWTRASTWSEWTDLALARPRVC